MLHNDCGADKWKGSKKPNVLSFPGLWLGVRGGIGRRGKMWSVLFVRAMKPARLGFESTL